MNGGSPDRPRAPGYVEGLIADQRSDPDDRFLHLGHWDDPTALDSSDDVAARQRLAEVLLDLVGLDGATAFLDVATGVGGLLGMVAERAPGIATVGIDVAEAALAAGRRVGGPEELFVRGDACRLPFASGAFDRVVCVEAALHFRSRSEFYLEAARVLIPGGRLVVSDLLFSRSAASALEQDLGSLMEVLEQEFAPWPEPGTDVGDVVAAATSAGFVDVEVVDATANVLPTYSAAQRFERPGAAAVSRTAAAQLFVHLQQIGVLRVVYLSMTRAITPAATERVPITSYADVRAALADERLVLDDAVVDCGQRRPLYPLQAVGAEHRDYRALLEELLVRSTRVEAVVDRWVRRLIPERPDAGSTGLGPVLGSAVARPLPGLVLLDLFGLPADHLEQWWSWHDSIHGSRLRGEERERRAEIGDEVSAYFVKHARERRGGSGADVITRLTGATVEGTTLADGQVARVCHLLLIAGLGTVAEALDAAIGAVCANPDRWREAASNPATLRVALNELLRWSSPAPGVARSATEAVDLPGLRVVSGTELTCSLIEANHDATVFPAADELDLTRSPNRHLSFGAGLHRCVGAPLALLQLSSVVSAILPFVSPAPAPSEPGRAG